MNRAVCSGNGPFAMLTVGLLSIATGCERSPPLGVDCAAHVSCGGPEDACQSSPEQIECKDLVPGSGVPAQPAVFGCGDTLCSVSQEYCEILIPTDRLPFEDPEVGITRTCRTLPPNCVEEASCECLHEETGRDEAEADCNRSREGGLTLSRRSSELCADGGTAPCQAPAITPRR